MRRAGGVIAYRMMGGRVGKGGAAVSTGEVVTLARCINKLKKKMEVYFHNFSDSLQLFMMKFQSCPESPDFSRQSWGTDSSSRILASNPFFLHRVVDL